VARRVLERPEQAPRRQGHRLLHSFEEFLSARQASAAVIADAGGHDFARRFHECVDKAVS
jgi:hypothetical protein